MNYIDRIAHEIAAAAGQPRPEPEYLDLYRLYALLALSTGGETNARNVHDAWAVWMADINPDHRSLLPFEQLTPEVQAMDAPYVEAIRRVARF